MVKALSQKLPNEVRQRLGGEVIATVAQEYLVSCPDIMIVVNGPKRCWRALCNQPDSGHIENTGPNSSASGGREQLVLDYWAESPHLFRRAALHFGHLNEKRFVRLANQRGCWITVERVEEESCTLNVSKRVPNVEPEQEPPSEDTSWATAWRVG